MKKINLNQKIESLIISIGCLGATFLAVIASTTANDNNQLDGAYYERFIDGYGPKGYLPPHIYPFRIISGPRKEILPALLTIDKNDKNKTVMDNKTLSFFNSWIKYELIQATYTISYLTNNISIYKYHTDCMEENKFKRSSNYFEIKEYNSICVGRIVEKYFVNSFYLDSEKARVQDLIYLQEHPEYAEQILKQYKFPHNFAAFREFVLFEKGIYASYPHSSRFLEFEEGIVNSKLEAAKKALRDKIVDCQYIKKQPKEMCWADKSLINNYQEIYRSSLLPIEETKLVTNIQ